MPRWPQLRDVHCPFCNHRLDASTAMDKREWKPRDGDLTVCIECGGVGQYAFPKDGPGRIDKIDYRTLPLDRRAEIMRMIQVIMDAKGLKQ